MNYIGCSSRSVVALRVKSYKLVLKAFCEEKKMDLAMELVNKMENEGGVMEGDFDSALEMCKEIIKRGWFPPFEATEVLVNGLVKMSRADEAKEVVEKMKERLGRGTSEPMDEESHWVKGLQRHVGEAIQHPR
ncbi:hypothetical protein RHMOL_Rhmol01G0328600 [Rhododendron molle]|uniref:Uncharacterized protein n=1 Tax=Rhododendron molle TaxID=49168 RepID=A0ACC0QBJ6_RHOML|nr:hypothetical protein RHMOL_Rhmol01G0328600 [Rhododendron molle]